MLPIDQNRMLSSGFFSLVRKVGSAASGLGLAAAVASGAAPVMAQSYQQNDDPNRYQNSSVPYGSPFRSSNSSSANGNSSSDDTSPSSNNRSGGNDSDRIGNGSSIEPVDVDRRRTSTDERDDDQQKSATERMRRLPPAPPNEFELYARKVLGLTRPLPRFGASLMVPEARDFAAPPIAAVPPAYILSAGDTITVSLTGSVEGELNLTLNSDGRVFIPRVGAVHVAGVRYADLRGVLSRAIGSQFRDFRVTPGIDRLRGVRVYVTGFANNPGAFSVNGLSTLVNAVLAAGGPSSGGSFRSIRLYRSGRLVSDFDLYDFIRRGDRSADAVVQNEDVIYIAPIGAQVAISGSVNAEAVYEAKAGETLSDLIGFSGGFGDTADRSRVVLYSIANRDKAGGVEVGAPALRKTPATSGDIVQVLSLTDFSQPLERQAVLVKLEGEVVRPGNYYVAPNTPLEQVLAQAGGLTERAFVYGMEFDRVSVREQQRKSFDDALDQLELSLAAAPIRGPSLGQDAASQAVQLAGARAVVDRLRRSQPSGRVILDVGPEAASAPAMTLENNDRVYIPPRPTTIGVFGAVYRPGSFQLGARHPAKWFVAAAGGAIREADQGRIFVVHANGQVVPRSAGSLGKTILPGDVVFVPIKTRSTSILPVLRDVTSLALSFGLTAAVLATLN